MIVDNSVSGLSINATISLINDSTRETSAAISFSSRPECVASLALDRARSASSSELVLWSCSASWVFC